MSRAVCHSETAAYFSTRANYVNPSALGYAPNVPGANKIGFTSIDAPLTTANNALEAKGYPPAQDPNKAHQELLYETLDKTKKPELPSSPTMLIHNTLINSDRQSLKNPKKSQKTTKNPKFSLFIVN